jgi:hypothetical protein
MFERICRVSSKQGTFCTLLELSKNRLGNNESTSLVKEYHHGGMAKMKWTLDRDEFYRDRVIGRLFHGSTDEWVWTLEDTDRLLEAKGVKIPKLTAIPRGEYDLQITFSNRFQQPMPLIVDVPLFTGIRIHDGGIVGQPVDTEGCVLVGLKLEAMTHDLWDTIGAYDRVFDWLTEDLKQGTCTIQVK